jgi:hypothetical protein
MAREKCHFAIFERSENIGIRRVSKRGLQPHFLRVFEARHVVQTAAADNSYLCLLHLRS